MPLNVRMAKPSDMGFIYKHWLKGYSYSFFARSIPRDIFFEIHEQLLLDLLSTSKTFIACNIDDPNHVFGFLTYHPSYIENKYILHYCYIKPSYRRMGFATKLKDIMLTEERGNIMKNAPIISTHFTKDANDFLKEWNIIYNPYILLRGIKDGLS